jgi:phosphopantothenoylcysteine decarboxylase/phosphopantothenate--cysteine ligase
MGFALAKAAQSRGADVTVVAGETTVDVPINVKISRAVSAEQMYAEVMKEIEGATVFIGAAAVSDYRPAKKATNKIKKSDSSLSISLEPTRDILAGVAGSRHNGLLVFGFAAETENLIENARQKLASKNLDLIVANDITHKGAGFNVDTNVITLLARNNTEPIALPLMSKLDAAHRILDEIVRFRQNSATP